MPTSVTTKCAVPGARDALLTIVATLSLPLLPPTPDPSPRSLLSFKSLLDPEPSTHSNSTRFVQACCQLSPVKHGHELERQSCTLTQSRRGQLLLAFDLGGHLVHEHNLIANETLTNRKTASDRHMEVVGELEQVLGHVGQQPRAQRHVVEAAPKVKRNRVDDDHANLSQTQ